MKHCALPLIFVALLIALISYASVQPSTHERMRAAELYKAKIYGDKEKFISLYGASSKRTIRLYEKRMEEMKTNQERVAEKRAMAEKAWNE